ncbi:hypothetical protein [Paraburkholderia acidiphila]|uniref:Uncharacterized protein n=1 Tax=Paraburkholderia acidiphila TaxID=2571747 RepID=A0A7Z2G5E9_9BURK|nr:hypothetical protein [Paraburkholderia acidiphila]QGZ55558.1 hypothetical protein FAZ97_11895 [Paraburkholderia acidiphila]
MKVNDIGQHRQFRQKSKEIDEKKSHYARPALESAGFKKIQLNLLLQKGVSLLGQFFHHRRNSAMLTLSRTNVENANQAISL